MAQRLGPILRAGRTLGVLVVQNRTMRTYREDEVEALETTGMVLAESPPLGPRLPGRFETGLQMALSAQLAAPES